MVLPLRILLPCLAGRDQLPQRITDEITRMETLAGGLRVRSSGERH